MFVYVHVRTPAHTQKHTTHCFPATPRLGKACSFWMSGGAFAFRRVYEFGGQYTPAADTPGGRYAAAERPEGRYASLPLSLLLSPVPVPVSLPPPPPPSGWFLRFGGTYVAGFFSASSAAAAAVVVVVVEVGAGGGVVGVASGSTSSSSSSSGKCTIKCTLTKCHQACTTIRLLDKKNAHARN